MEREEKGSKLAGKRKLICRDAKGEKIGRKGILQTQTDSKIHGIKAEEAGKNGTARRPT